MWCVGSVTSATTITSTASNLTLFDGPVAPSAASSSYPIQFSFSGFSAASTALSLSISFTGLSHTNLQDLDMMLVSPAGMGYLFMSDCFAATTNGTWTFAVADSGSAQMSGSGQPVNGTTYVPTNRSVGDTFPAPAPSTFTSAPPNGTQSTLAGAFAGNLANGIWKVYIADDVANNSFGSIAQLSLTISDSVPGATKYWDLNGSSSGVGGAGPATWDTTTANWNTSSAGTNAPTTFAQVDAAVFGGTAGVVNVAAAGVVVDGGIKFASNGYTINAAGAGPLMIGGGGTIDVQDDGFSIRYAARINAAIAGSTGLFKTGTGTLVLGGNNTFTGSVSIDRGVLDISSDANLGNPSNLVAFGQNNVTFPGTLHLTDNVTTNRTLSSTIGDPRINFDAGKRFTINTSLTGIKSLGGGGTLSLPNQNPNHFGGLQISGGSKLDTGSTGTLAISANINYSGGSGLNPSELLGNLLLDHGEKNFFGPTFANSSVIDLVIHSNITSPVRITNLGANSKLELRGDNTYMTGGLRVGRVYDGTNLAESGGTVTVLHKLAAGNGAVELAYGTFAAVTPLTGASALPVTVPLIISGGAQGNPASLAGADMEFNGVARLYNTDQLAAYQHRLNVYNTTRLNGALTTSLGPGTDVGLTIGGSGTFVLAAPNNDYPGVITVADTATLKVLNSVSSLTVNSGGTFSPGGSPGVATINTLTLQPSATLFIELGGPTPGAGAGYHDQVIITGSAQVGGSKLSVADFGNFLAAHVTPLGTVFKIITLPGTAPIENLGAFDGLAEMAVIDVGDTSLRISYAGGDGNDVTLTLVPEPGSTSLFLVAELSCVRRRRSKSWRSSRGNAA